MSKQAALEKLDALLDRGTHAHLNASPGVNIVRELQQIRDEVDEIEEA